MASITSVTSPGLSSVRTRSSRRWREGLGAWGFVAPFLLAFLLFRLGPVVGGFFTSLTRWQIVGTPEFVGLGNYQRLLFRDPLFITAVRNTFWFLVLVAPPLVIGGFLLALLLNQPLRGRTVARTVVFASYAVMSTVVGVIWNWLYETHFGIVNYYLGTLHLPTIAWLTNEHAAMPAIALTTIWWTMGYDTLLFMAGLQEIPTEVMEAARLDGARGLRMLRHITLPLLKPVTIVVVMLTIINSFQVFDQVFVMTDGGPGTSTLTLVQYLYVQAFQNFNLGYGSAVAYIVFIILAVLAVVQFRLLRAR